MRHALLLCLLLTGCATAPTKTAPVAPMTLKAAAAPPPSGSFQAVLNWSASTSKGVTNYNAYMGLSSRAYTSVKSTSGLTTTFTGLAKNTLYFFSVTAVDTNRLESLYSNEATYRTPKH